MSFFKSVGSVGSVKDVLKLNRSAGKALLQYHTAVLRQPSQLTEQERELIAAYVSGLNDCRYCHGVHRVAARVFGLEAGVLSALLEDIDSAPVEKKLKPIFAYAKQLTQEPAKITQAHADAVLGAGWDEQALHDAINVICLFNFMNRLVEGHGLLIDSALFQERGKVLHDSGYEPVLDELEKGEGI